jgi:hypothetical protein
MVGQPQSWSFVNNPTLSTDEAWVECFGREPRCMEWSAERYKKVGFTDERISNLPDISCRALKRFPIGREGIALRESENSHALWVGLKAASDNFKTVTENFSGRSELTLET